MKVKVDTPSLKELEDTLDGFEGQPAIGALDVRNALVLLLREAISARHDRENDGDFRERDD